MGDRQPGLRATIDQALKAAQTDCNVVIVGETGTGKDLVAGLPPGHRTTWSATSFT